MWKRKRQLCKCGHAKSFHRLSSIYRQRNLATCNFGECKCREFRPTETQTDASPQQKQPIDTSSSN
jgi:hypothetical protein